MASARGLPLGEDVEDAGISGKNLKRPGIDGLIQEAEEGTLGGIIVWKLDRLTRSLRDLLALMERFHRMGVGFISVQENIDTVSPMGKLMMHLMGALAQFEREQTSERIRFVQAHKRSEGGYIGGPIPTGLKTIKDGRNRKLVRDETYAPILARCWSLVIEGASLREVGKYFDDSKVPTRDGKPWSKNATGQILRNPRYVGLLVNQEMFDRAGRTLGGRFSPATARSGVKPIGSHHMRPTERVWRLQGIAVCAICGMAMVGSQSMGRGRWYAYLRCSGRQKRLDDCVAPDLRADQVEDLVIAAIVKGAHIGEITAVLSREQATRQLTVAPLRKRVAELQKQRDKERRQVDVLLDLVVQGAAVAKAAAPRISEHQGEIDRIELEMAELEGRLAAATISKQDLDAVAETLRLGLAELPQQPWGEQKAILAGLVKRVKIAAGAPLTIEIGVPLAQVRTDVREWCAI